MDITNWTQGDINDKKQRTCHKVLVGDRMCRAKKKVGESRRWKLDMIDDVHCINV